MKGGIEACSAPAPASAIDACPILACECPACPANADCACDCPPQPPCPAPPPPPPSCGVCPPGWQAPIGESYLCCHETREGAIECFSQGSPPPPPPPPPPPYGYATPVTVSPDLHHAIRPADGASETFEFAWHDAPGAAPPADLWVEAEGHTVLQVSAVTEHPFVRAGLEVVSLSPDAKYDIVFARHGEALDLSVTDAEGRVLHAERIADTTADVVLPATTFWRTAIVGAR